MSNLPTIFEIDLDPINKMAALVTSKGFQFWQTKRPRQIFWDTKPDVDLRFPGYKQHDLTNRRFGRLVVVGYYGKGGHLNGRRKNRRPGSWLVRCDCGIFETRKTHTLKKNKYNRCQFCDYLKYLKEVN